MALTLLAFALLIAPSCPPGGPRLRRLGLGSREASPRDAHLSGRWSLPIAAGAAVGLLAATAIGGLAGILLAVPLSAAATAACRMRCGPGTVAAADPLQLAGGWDLLAACLRSGLPVPLAVRAVAEHLPAAAATELRTIADRLALGADPLTAWEVTESSPLHKLARAARRSARSGASLASVATAAAAEVRGRALDVAAERGQRAGVLITGPLGLCFLPAFLVLGVVPVVIGLATGLAQRW